jgi:hypothetical protein
MANLIWEMPDMPPLDSEYMDSLARFLMNDMLPYWKNSRRSLERQWLENDRGYLCVRRLPMMEGMDYVDASPYGEDDIFNGVNNLSLRLSLASMPKDESWLTVVGRSGEPPQLVNAVQAQQLWMHRKAGTRKVFSKHYKQLIVRGTSYLYMRWHKEMKYRRLGTLQGRKRLRKHFKALGQDQSVIKQINSVRVPTVEFEGPVVRVLDSYDVWMDPEADLLCDRRPGMIIVTAYQPSDLEAATDDFGEKMFENYKDISPMKASDFYWGTAEGTRRLQSLNNMGVRPQQHTTASADIVPVYTFYKHYFKWNDMEFHDTYFHVAQSTDGKHRVIRVEENPSDEGHRLILQDTFIKFFTNVAYGLSGVEKLLSAWHQKNFLAAIMLNAAAATAFPAQLIASGVFKDDQPFMTPGALNEVAMSALQAGDVVKPMPVPERGLQLSFENMEYYKRKIGGGFEVTGAYGNGSQQGNRETATSVNFRATNQGLAVDELTEEFGDTLQSMCQWSYDMNQQTAVPEEAGRGRDGVVRFGRIVGNSVQPGELKFDEWLQPRSIEVLGLHGVANKQQAIMNKNEALKAIGQTSQYLPNAPALTAKVVRSLFTDLNIETDDQDWLSPAEIAMQDPAAQALALESGLHNQELVNMVLSKVNGVSNGPQNNPGGPAAGQPPKPSNGRPVPRSA